MNNIAEFYREWMSSRPFDIGFTTKDALRLLKAVKDPKDYCKFAKIPAHESN